MISKQNIIKIVALSGMIASSSLFGAVAISNPHIPAPSNAQALHQQYVAQQAQAAPQENSDEYAFKKRLRSLPGIAYYPLMCLYATFNGYISGIIEAVAIQQGPDIAAPFTLEVVDFVYDEVDDKHKDHFELFFEFFGKMNALNIMEMNAKRAASPEEKKELRKRFIFCWLNQMGGNLEDFTKGDFCAFDAVIKTILRAKTPASINGGKFHPGCVFEPVYPLLFDGIVTQLPEDIKKTDNQKRLIRGARGLIRAVVRTAIY